MRPSLAHLVLAMWLAGAPLTRATDAATNSTPVLPRADAKGNPLRRAPTGHVSNYDEAKVGEYTLPDPLGLRSGKAVRDADAWFKQRRPEILKLYETEIYGRVPAQTPPIKFEVVATDLIALSNSAIRKDIIGRIGGKPDAPKVNVVMYLPAKATGPVPVLLHVLFGNPPTSSEASTNSTRPGEIGPLSDMLARGYGYATFRYTEIEGDTRTNNLNLVRKLALASGQTELTADDWGTITAWA